MNETIAFDPGIGELVFDFYDFINKVYSQLNLSHTIHVKKAKFKLYSGKIYKYMRNNIAFYMGCLLWAVYLSKENNNPPKIITGNVFSALTKEQIENYDFLQQINFLESYFDKYSKDILFYTGQKIQIPYEWIEIIKLYKEFITVNNGFISTKTTADLILPEKLKNTKFSFNIKSIIDEVINKKDLEILLNIDGLTF